MMVSRIHEFVGDHLPCVDVEQALTHKVVTLYARTRWHPGEADIQRGRAALQGAFEQPHNLPLPEFAHLAGKSRDQIYKGIKAHRLLALSVGPSGQKLPDWQLDPVKLQLTQIVLQKAEGINSWTMYHALSEPLEGLGGCSSIESVTAGSIDDVALAVLNVLGVR